MLVGYIWTSDADDQDERAYQYQVQHQALLQTGVLAEHIYKDLSGLYRGPRPQLERCLQDLIAGDTLVVAYLDGLAFSRSHLLTIFQDLESRQIGLKVLVGKGSVIDTEQIELAIIIAVIEALSEFEERTVRAVREKGIAVARARGQAFGPKRKMTADIIRQAMNYIVNSDMSFTKVAETLGVTRSSLYTYLNGDGSPKPPAQKLLAADATSEATSAVEDDSSSSSTNL